MNIDVILYKYFPNDVRPRKEAEVLRREGHSVRVFCLREAGEKKREFCSNGIEVVRVFDTTEESRIDPIRMLLFWIAVIRVWTRRNGMTTIHCHDLSALPAGFVIATLNRLHLIYDSHELFPESAWERVHFIAYLLFCFLEILCCIKVNALVGVSEPQVEFLQRRCPCPSIYLNNYPSLEEIDYLYHEQSTGPMIVGMSGYLYKTRGHSEVMDALEILARNGTDVEFWIVGDGPQMSVLKTKADEMSYQTRFFGYIKSRQEMWHLISKFDYAVIANHPSRNYLMTSTNRSYEYAALGVPFICPHYSGISDILIALDLPDFNPLNPASIRNAIETLMKRPRRKMSLEGRELVESRFNWATTSRKLLRLYSFLENEDLAKD